MIATQPLGGGQEVGGGGKVSVSVGVSEAVATRRGKVLVGVIKTKTGVEVWVAVRVAAGT